jgi:hypothetical protein
VGREVAVVLVEPGAIRTAFRDTLAKAWGDLPGRALGTRYEAVITHYLAQRKGQAERYAMDAETCARRLLEVLEAEHPPRRLVIGWDAIWADKLKALLPAGWWEGLLRRMYGLDYL